jgi:hypothetical protein
MMGKTGKQQKTPTSEKQTSQGRRARECKVCHYKERAQIEQDFMGFYLLLRHYPDPVQKAAFSFIGTVVGYWLR